MVEDFGMRFAERIGDLLVGGSPQAQDTEYADAQGVGEGFDLVGRFDGEDRDGREVAVGHIMRGHSNLLFTLLRLDCQLRCIYNAGWDYVQSSRVNWPRAAAVFPSPNPCRAVRWSLLPAG